MKRTSLALAAVLALAFPACEKHNAAETKDSLEPHGSHEGGHAAEGPNAQSASSAHAPEGVNTNPAGSGPADPHDPALDKGKGGKEPGAVKYFPQEEKK